MKAFLLFLGLATSVNALIGCANDSQNSSSPGTSATRFYTNDDLQRTGKRDSGEALRAVDPAVTTTTGGR